MRPHLLPETRRLRALLWDLLSSEQLLEAAEVSYSAGPAVSLPGFCLLDRSGVHRPLAWLDLKPLNEEELLHDYEEFADMRWGHHQSAMSRQAFSMLSNWGLGRFGYAMRPASAWFEPTALLIGLLGVASFGDVKVQRDRVSLRLASTRFSVTSRGIWSNSRERQRQAVIPASDAALLNLRVPEMFTDHPMARALVEVKAPLHCRWALSMLLLRQQAPGARQINRQQFFTRDRHLHWASPPVAAPRVRPSRAKVKREIDAAYKAAVANAMQFAEENSPGVAEELERVLVPTVMTSSQLRTLLGPAYRRETALKTRVFERVYNHLNSLGTVVCRPEHAH